MIATIDIINFREEFIIEIVDLFHLAVHSIDPVIYSLEEQEAWAPTPPNYTKWSLRLKKTKPFLAIVDYKLVGFIELDNNGHIDCLYTHPSNQREGVASALFNHLLVHAKNMNLQYLYVEASYLAKEFFEKQGFKVVKQNKVIRNDVILSNFTMIRKLFKE